MEFTVRAPDNPEGTRYTIAPENIARAICRRFDHRLVVCHPTETNTFIYDPGNFWDGPTHVIWFPHFGHFAFSGWNGPETFPMIGPLR